MAVIFCSVLLKIFSLSGGENGKKSSSTGASRTKDRGVENGKKTSSTVAGRGKEGVENRKRELVQNRAARKRQRVKPSRMRRQQLRAVQQAEAPDSGTGPGLEAAVQRKEEELRLREHSLAMSWEKLQQEAELELNLKMADLERKRRDLERRQREPAELDYRRQEQVEMERRQREMAFMGMRDQDPLWGPRQQEAVEWEQRRQQEAADWERRQQQEAVEIARLEREVEGGVCETRSNEDNKRKVQEIRQKRDELRDMKKRAAKLGSPLYLRSRSNKGKWIIFPQILKRDD